MNMSRNWTKKKKNNFWVNNVKSKFEIELKNKHEINLLILNRLLDWEERPDIQRQKYEKVVVIKGLFTDEDIRVKIVNTIKIK
jgi:hypothetical protein